MSDEHLVFPEQQGSAPKQPVTPDCGKKAQPAAEHGPDRGAGNRGHRAGASAAGEATGSGASAGGGGGPEDIDSDPKGGGGAVRVDTDDTSPGRNADAPSHGSA